MIGIKIISDGTGNNTRVLNCDGTEICGITSILIDEIKTDCLVTATVKFTAVELELDIKKQVNKK